jgi:nucleolar protein 58
MASSYGLFKSADKKLLKNDNLAEELGRPEKLVEMYVSTLCL